LVFGKTNKTVKLQARLTKKEKEKIQITSVRNEIGNMIINPADIKKIRGYWEYFCVYSFFNLDEINQFFKSMPPQLHK
jgi:hypothetical protein